MRKKWFLIVPAAILGILLFVFLGGQLVLQLWNWLLPPLFGWRAITFWQALGLLALCRILFGGFGHRGHGGPNFRHRMRMRMGMKDPCGNMAPEERERFRQAMRERWAFGSSPSESKGQ